MMGLASLLPVVFSPSTITVAIVDPDPETAVPTPYASLEAQFAEVEAKYGQGIMAEPGTEAKYSFQFFQDTSVVPLNGIIEDYNILYGGDTYIIESVIDNPSPVRNIVIIATKDR